MPELSRRVLDVSSKVEIREAPDGKRFIEGLIPYNSRSEDMWSFVEEIAPGAFSKTLNDGADVKCFWGHDETDVLGTRKNGTLVLEDKSDGLHFSVEMRDTEVSKDHFEAVKRGDVPGVSFGFQTMRDEWNYDATPHLRTLKEVKLFEVSVGVAFPAYPGAQSATALRSLYAEAGVDIAAALASRHKPDLNPDPAPEPSPEPIPAPSAMTPEERARAELDLIAAEYGINQ